MDHKNGETFAWERAGFGYKASELDEDLVAYIHEFSEAIGYFGFSYYYANMALLKAVAIENDKGDHVLPNPETIGDGSYNPLSHSIYMNLHNHKDSLEKTVPFIQFGLSHPILIEVTGYVPIPDSNASDICAVINEAVSGAISHRFDHGIMLAIVMIGSWVSVIM